jgi:hypothetical protein
VPGERQGKRSKRARMEAEAEEAMRLANGDESMDVDMEEGERSSSSKRRSGVTDRTPKSNRMVQNLTSAVRFVFFSLPVPLSPLFRTHGN